MKNKKLAAFLRNLAANAIATADLVESGAKLPKWFPIALDHLDQSNACLGDFLEEVKK